MTELSQRSQIVQFNDVALSYGASFDRVDVLRDVSLVIEQGQSVAVVGPSGSGKSSLLMLMTGMERPTTGQVFVEGVLLNTLSEDQLARFRRDYMGIVFQSFHLIPTMTALENVAIPLELAGVDDAWSRAGEELDAVGLSHRHGHYPSQLSGGEQQRVALARALVARPAIVLADEPTGNLDPETGALVADLLFELPKKRGATLLLITHDHALAARCDRKLHIRHHTVVEECA
jgi:putative ABC transport system ATP-binding protein